MLETRVKTIGVQKIYCGNSSCLMFIAGLFIRAPVEEIMIGENDPSDHDDGAIDDLIRINGRRTATWRKLTTSK